MARLQDIPRLLSVVGPWDFTKRVWKEISDDGLFVWASALAYAWLFAIFPFFIFLLTLLPYMPASVKLQAEGTMHDALKNTLATEAARAARHVAMRGGAGKRGLPRGRSHRGR